MCVWEENFVSCQVGKWLTFSYFSLASRWISWFFQKRVFFFSSCSFYGCRVQCSVDERNMLAHVLSYGSFRWLKLKMVERERSNTSRSRIWNNPGAVEMIKGTGFFPLCPPQPFWLLSSFDKLEKAHLFQVCNCVGIDSTCLSRWFAVLVDNRPDVRIQKSSLSKTWRCTWTRPHVRIHICFIHHLSLFEEVSSRNV